MDKGPVTKKLVEQMSMLISAARTCETMIELRDRMAALNGMRPPTDGVDGP